jgi:hypothetical protein
MVTPTLIRHKLYTITSIELVIVPKYMFFVLLNIVFYIKYTGIFLEFAKKSCEIDCDSRQNSKVIYPASTILILV